MYEDFIQKFKEFQIDAYMVNEAHGFNETDHKIDELMGPGSDLSPADSLYQAFKYARKGLKLMLIVSELAEALEGMRKGKERDDHIPGFTPLEAEAADAIIRIMNLCFPEKVRLAEAIVAKNEYNRTRPFKHGNKIF